LDEAQTFVNYLSEVISPAFFSPSVVEDRFACLPSSLAL